MPAAREADDPSVCYRHPDRPSWTLCERCGRTICPECQILTPAGVRCPDCVRETGGSVQWTPVNVRPAKAATRARVRATRDRRPLAGGLLANAAIAGAPASWTIAITTLALWLVGLFTANFPLAWLAGFPSLGWQLWRFATAAVVYPAALDFFTILLLVLNLVFFLLTAPAVERTIGRRSFLIVFFAASAFGTAAMTLSGGLSYGLFPAVFGLFGTYLVLMWSVPPARVQLLISLGLNLVIVLALSSSLLPGVVGGLIAGAGAMFLLRRYEDTPRRAYLFSTAGVAVLVVLAIVRSLIVTFA